MLESRGRQDSPTRTTTATEPLSRSQSQTCHIPEEELFALPLPPPYPPPLLLGGFTRETLQAPQIKISEEKCADTLRRVTSEETAVVMATSALRTDVYFV